MINIMYNLTHIKDWTEKFKTGLLWQRHVHKVGNDVSKHFDFRQVREIYGYFEGLQGIEPCVIIGTLTDGRYFYYEQYILVGFTTYNNVRLDTFQTLDEFLIDRKVLDIFDKNSNGYFTWY